MHPTGHHDGPLHLWYRICMTSKLDEAVAAAKRLPEDEQDSIAALINRQVLERAVARGEASLAAGGAIPAEAVFDRLERKYGG